MPRGKRAESNGLAEAKALAAKEAEGHEPETEAAEDAEEGDDAPGAGHNLPTFSDDERFSLLSHHKRAIVRLREVKKAAAKAVKDAEKLCKAELGADAVAEVDTMIQLETVEGEALFKAEVERQVRMARLMGLPVGTTGNLFEAVDRSPGVDRAAGAGKRAGLAGDPCDCPHDPSTEQYAAWMTGYAEGQKTMFAIKPLIDKATEEFDTLIPADEPPAPESEAA